MKKLLLIIPFLLFLNKKTFAQHVIMAKEAYRHVGERLTVRDSVYFGKVYNDSTAVVELGNRRYIAPLTVIFSAGKNKLLDDPKFVSNYLQRGKISVNGLILMIKGHPTILVSDWNALKVD